MTIAIGVPASITITLLCALWWSPSSQTGTPGPRKRRDLPMRHLRRLLPVGDHPDIDATPPGIP